MVQIQGLPPPEGVTAESVLSRVCAAVASAMGCEAREVWATWAEVAPGCYVEGDQPAWSQPRSTHPPIARLIAFEGRDPAVVEAALWAVASALSSSLGVELSAPFVVYEEVRSGRVLTGGVVRRRG